MSERLNVAGKDLVATSELILKMAHDIRSPLTALLAVMNATGEFTEKKRCLALRATLRMQEIAESTLRTYKKNRIEIAGQEKVNIASALTQVMEEKCTLLPPDIHLQYKSDNGQCLFVDAAKACELQRIVSNLINNSIEAVKYKVDAKIVLKIIKKKKKFAEIKVEDNGSGISKAQLKKIGKKGFTLKNDGNGLGIYFAKELLKSWGGKLRISSKEGLGTKVSLIFPV